MSKLYYVHTIFSKGRDRPVALVISHNSKIAIVPIYIRGNHLTYYRAQELVKAVKQKVFAVGNTIVLNDFKRHMAAFGLNDDVGLTIYDTGLQHATISTMEQLDEVKDAIAAQLEYGPYKWQEILARAAVVYKYLQDRGVLYFGNSVYPTWDLNTFSGRSKTSGTNIQGMSSEDDLMNISCDPILIHFDWVAADIRAIAFMSQDQKLLGSFIHNDPYQYMADKMVNVGMNRGDCKRMLFEAIYSMNLNNEALLFYRGLRQWIQEMRHNVLTMKTTKSILGREFALSKDRSHLSIMNAMCQGSVAHAMQLSIRRIWDIYPDNILSEHHDSIVMTAKSTKSAKKIIFDVAGIMLYPFEGILKDNPAFPLKVSIGRKFKQWALYKRFDDAEALQKERAKAESN
jgi:hypothetical protein